MQILCYIMHNDIFYSILYYPAISDQSGGLLDPNC